MSTGGSTGGTDAGAPTRLDWPGLMRVGLRQLGLRPAEFWALSPAELMVILGLAPGAGPMTRGGLEALLQRFPDRNGAGAETHITQGEAEDG